MSASRVSTYQAERIPRSSIGRRIAGALGVDPVFVALLALALPVGAGLGAAVAMGDRGTSAAAAPVHAAIEVETSSWETTWLLPIRLHAGRPVGGIQRLEVPQGDGVAIGVDLDAAATISVEGYGIWTYVRPFEQGVLELTAWEWGRFEVRADGRLIGELTVRPVWAGRVGPTRIGH